MARSSFDFSAGSAVALLRLAVPQAMLLLLMLLNLMALPVPYAGMVKPMFLMMAVYYWSIWRPTLVPPWWCFVLGLLTDLLSGAPLGVNAFTVLAVRWVVCDQRRFLMGQPFVMVWALFGVLMGVIAMIEWALFGVVRGWTPIMPAAAGVVVSLFMYPPVSFLLVFAHRLLPTPSRRGG